MLSYPNLFLDLHVAIAFGLFFAAGRPGNVRSSPLWIWRGMLGADGLVVALLVSQFKATH